jgi:hypothetical protein
MATKRRATRRGGPTQPESERQAGQRKLRLLPAVQADLDRLAELRGLSVSAYVSALVMADACGLVAWDPVVA